jgi:hypothetical protein
MQGEHRCNNSGHVITTPQNCVCVEWLSCDVDFCPLSARFQKMAAVQQHNLLTCLALLLVHSSTVAHSLDTTCDFKLIPEIASELIRRISKFPTEGYDVKPGVDVTTFSHQPIPLYSQYISLEQDGEVKRPPPFVHYADVTVEQAVEAYCSTTGKSFKDDCLTSLTQSHTKDKEFRKSSSKTISRSLEAFKNNRLPAYIDFADVAAG